MSVVDIDLDRLGLRLSGQLIRPQDADYEASRHVWNGMIDRRPRAIARCTSEADVTAAIKFAAEHGFVVSVRGGGQNVADNAVCEDGLDRSLRSERRLQYGQFQKALEFHSDNK